MGMIIRFGAMSVEDYLAKMDRDREERIDKAWVRGYNYIHPKTGKNIEVKGHYDKRMAKKEEEREARSKKRVARDPDKIKARMREIEKHHAHLHAEHERARLEHAGSKPRYAQHEWRDIDANFRHQKTKLQNEYAQLDADLKAHGPQAKAKAAADQAEARRTKNKIIAAQKAKEARERADKIRAEQRGPEGRERTRREIEAAEREKQGRAKDARLKRPLSELDESDLQLLLSRAHSKSPSAEQKAEWDRIKNEIESRPHVGPHVYNTDRQPIPGITAPKTQPASIREKEGKFSVSYDQPLPQGEADKYGLRAVRSQPVGGIADDSIVALTFSQGRMDPYARIKLVEARKDGMLKSWAEKLIDQRRESWRDAGEAALAEVSRDYEATKAAVEHPNQLPSTPDAPREGEQMLSVAGNTLVLRGGRWHRVEEAEKAETPKYSIPAGFTLKTTVDIPEDPPIADAGPYEWSQGGGEYGGKNDGFFVGQIVRNNDQAVAKGQARYIKITDADQRYYREDGMSFGVGADRGYVYSAAGIPATAEESAKRRAEDAKKITEKLGPQNRRMIAQQIREHGESVDWTKNHKNGEAFRDIEGNQYYQMRASIPKKTDDLIIADDGIYYVFDSSSYDDPRPIQAWRVARDSRIEEIIRNPAVVSEIPAQKFDNEKMAETAKAAVKFTPPVWENVVRGGGLGSDAKVARITGTDPQYGFAREWIDFDDSRSGSGKSGKMTWRISAPGVYELRNFNDPDASIAQLQRQSGGAQYIEVLPDGSEKELTKRDVLLKFKTASEIEMEQQQKIQAAEDERQAERERLEREHKDAESRRQAAEAERDKRKEERLAANLTDPHKREMRDKGWGHFIRNEGDAPIEHTYGYAEKMWLARVTGTNVQWGFAQEFVEPTSSRGRTFKINRPGLFRDHEGDYMAAYIHPNGELQWKTITREQASAIASLLDRGSGFEDARIKVMHEDAEKYKPVTQSLPALSGTPAQIKWAKDIRAKFMEQVKAMPEGKEREKALKVIEARKTAKWWIENR